MQATFIDQKKLVVGNCQMGTKKLLDWGDDLVGNSTCYMNRENGAQTPRIHISRGCGHKHACNSSTAGGWSQEGLLATSLAQVQRDPASKAVESDRAGHQIWALCVCVPSHSNELPVVHSTSRCPRRPFPIAADDMCALCPKCLSVQRHWS